MCLKVTFKFTFILKFIDSEFDLLFLIKPHPEELKKGKVKRTHLKDTSDKKYYLLFFSIGVLSCCFDPKKERIKNFNEILLQMKFS